MQRFRGGEQRIDEREGAGVNSALFLQMELPCSTQATEPLTVCEAAELKHQAVPPDAR